MYAGRIMEYSPIQTRSNRFGIPTRKALDRSLLEEKPRRLNVIPGQVPTKRFTRGMHLSSRCYLSIEECKKKEPPSFR